MKTRLLSLTLLVTQLYFGQTPIEQFRSAEDAQYTVLSGTIDQSPSGADQTWNFTNLTARTTLLTDTYTETTTTAILETLEGDVPQSRIALSITEGELAITGGLSQEVTLAYSQDAAVMGTFPLEFNYNFTDNLQGTFTSTMFNGDILPTSTITTSVDAWGTLQVGTFEGEVTRLKIEQTLDLSVEGFSIGQGVQTTYLYYDAASEDLVFRTTRLNIPFADIDETVMEALSILTLSDRSIDAPKAAFSILENPVRNVLKLSVSNHLAISAIRILDVSGRLVKRIANDDPYMNIGALHSGTYIISLDTNVGALTSKFIKE